MVSEVPLVAVGHMTYELMPVTPLSSFGPRIQGSGRDNLIREGAHCPREVSVLRELNQVRIQLRIPVWLNIDSGER